MEEEERRAAEDTAKAIHAIREKTDALEKSFEMTTREVLKTSDFLAFQAKVTADLESIDKALQRESARSSATKAVEQNEQLIDAYLKALRYQALSREGSSFAKAYMPTEKELELLKADSAPHYSFNAGDGGILAPMPEMLGNIIDLAIRDIDPIVGRVQTYTSATGSLWIPAATAHTTVAWNQEGGAIDTTKDAQFGRIQLNTALLTGNLPITIDLLEQPGFDLKAWLVNDVSESMAIEEGSVIVSGTGAGGKPVGLLNSSISFNYEAQGEASTLTNGDALIKMQYNENLKDMFVNKCVYVMKRATMGSIAVLKGSDGQYLMQSLPSSTEKMISGFPVVFSPSMPAIGAGAYPVLFADLKNAYALLRRPTAYAVVMDNLTKAYQGIIRWYFRRYVGGQPVNTQAYLALKIATS